MHGTNSFRPLWLALPKGKVAGSDGVGRRKGGGCTTSVPRGSLGVSWRARVVRECVRRCVPVGTRGKYEEKREHESEREQVCVNDVCVCAAV